MNEQDGERMAPDEGHASAQPPQAMTAGARLAAERQSRGWAIEDVAAQLNLAPRQVHAIETDNHAALPGMPITRGFIRAYAKLLKIDAAPLLAGLGGETAAPAENAVPRKMTATPFAESRLPTLGERKRSSLPVFAVVVVLLLAAGGYWLFQNPEMLPAVPGSAPAVVEGQSAAEPAPPMVSEPVAPPAIDPAAPAAVPPAESSASPSPPAAADAQQPPVPSTVPAAPASPAPAPVAEPSAGPAGAVSQGATGVTVANTVSGTGGAASEDLLLRAREETWVEIKRVNGSDVVFSRLLKPGESQAIPVTEPLSLVVGNASGIDLSLRGAPLPLKGGSGNVSRITVK